MTKENSSHCVPHQLVLSKAGLHSLRGLQETLILKDWGKEASGVGMINLAVGIFQVTKVKKTVHLPQEDI